MLTFDHRFEDASGAITHGTVGLTAQDIEIAGIREVLQTPGAGLSNWHILDALLDKSASSFKFLRPLGQAREVKTAISGLFGRFVARAYANRYLGMHYFGHVTKPPLTLIGTRLGVLHRVPGQNGDMPDWVTWGPRHGLAIIEAKGSHDPKGPEAALDRAFAQANRAEIRIGRRLASFKRFAIATRWGFRNPPGFDPMLWVKDPDQDGELSAEEKDDLQVAMARWHSASLLEPLGFADLASALIEQNHQDDMDVIDLARLRAREALAELRPVRVFADGHEPKNPMIGGFVTKAGPIGPEVLSREDFSLLSRLGLRPMFVGIELSELKAAIENVPREKPQLKVAEGVLEERHRGDDGSGSWVLSLDQGSVVDLI